MQFCKLSNWQQIVLIFIVGILLKGCTSLQQTQPNPTANINESKALAYIHKKNKLLAQELAKLPEVINGITYDEEVALNSIFILYNRNPINFDKTFNEMYRVGKPEIRKYCTPLRLMFWISEYAIKGLADTKEIHRIVHEYNLKKLIDVAWIDKNVLIARWKLREIKNFLEKIENKELKKSIRTTINTVGDDEEALDTIVNNGQEFSNFRYNQKNLAEILTNHKTRFGEIKSTMEMLNSPQIINLYQQKFISYKTSYPNHCNGNNSRLFRTGRGCCGCYTRFSYDCLRIAGYEAKPIQVKSPTTRSYHLVCEFRDKDDKLYIMDNSCKRCTLGRGILAKEIYVKTLPQLREGWHY